MTSRENPLLDDKEIDYLKIYKYIGLATSNKTPKLETSGLGDRILRWLVVGIWATQTKIKIIIPIKCGKLPHEKIWTSTKLTKYFRFPDSIILIDGDNIDTDLDKISSFYLEERRMFVAAFNFWDAVPNKFKGQLDKSMFIKIPKNTKIEPLAKREFLDNYIVLHIRQSDVTFDVIPVLLTLIEELNKLNKLNKLNGKLNGKLKIFIISDASKSYIKNIETILNKYNIATLNNRDELEYEPEINRDKDKDKDEDESLEMTLLKDYNIMWYSNGIISLSKRTYSSFPYCVARQQNIPLIFYPKSCFKGPLICRSISMFFEKLEL